jgi:hypothetical protein
MMHPIECREYIPGGIDWCTVCKKIKKKENLVDFFSDEMTACT